ncbi:MAG TPA: hypothetical protein VGS02_08695, partial [Acidobacteriaceae bacterium]|nr:hypothetical protein [Acidobacteriaceae bacterium]
STYTINGVSPITFAQVAAATPQSSVSTVTLAYPSAEAAGDLNIVVVGWNDTTATVQSVTDSAGNTYQLAVGPTSGTALRQSIYYASGIRSGSNTVTVTFSQAAVNPDVRILEYRGVSTLDATAAASGSGTTASSGAATIHSNSELIFGANTVSTGNSGAGSGFTARIITSPDSDLAEDKTVTTTGSYSATAPLTSSGAWVMQMATFSAAPATPTPATMISPTPGSTLAGSSTTFTWNAGSGVSSYYLWIGTTAGGNDLYQAAISGTSTTTSLPTNGATIYVRLWSVINGGLQYNDYTYTEFNAVPATMISPAPGSTLTGSSTTFTWTAGSGASSYYLWIGITAGGNDLYQAGISTTSATVSLPTSGATVYVRLWSVINGGLQHNDYSYTEFNPAPATMISPAPGSTLTGSSTTFTWTAGSGASSYYLWIGTTAGGNDLYQAGLSGTSTTVNLPTNGATVYVRLWSVINGALQYKDYTYTELNPVPATMISPTPGTTLTGASTTFTWTTGSGVSYYYLWIGTTAGGNDLYQAGIPGTSTTVSLPTNGVTIYVRLWSVINGGLQFHDYTYTEF